MFSYTQERLLQFRQKEYHAVPLLIKTFDFHIQHIRWTHLFTSFPCILLVMEPCEHVGGFTCYGTCQNFSANLYCQCPKGTYGDPFTQDGCNKIKNSLVITGEKATASTDYLALYLSRISVMITLQVLQQ